MTPSPTDEPTLEPTVEPTIEPSTGDPTIEPTKEPTIEPTPQPTEPGEPSKCTKSKYSKSKSAKKKGSKPTKAPKSKGKSKSKDKSKSKGKGKGKGKGKAKSQKTPPCTQYPTVAPTLVSPTETRSISTWSTASTLFASITVSGALVALVMFLGFKRCLSFKKNAVWKEDELPPSPTEESTVMTEDKSVSTRSVDFELKNGVHDRSVPTNFFSKGDITTSNNNNVVDDANDLVDIPLNDEEHAMLPFSAAKEESSIHDDISYANEYEHVVDDESLISMDNSVYSKKTIKASVRSEGIFLPVMHDLDNMDSMDDISEGEDEEVDSTNSSVMEKVAKVSFKRASSNEF